MASDERKLSTSSLIPLEIDPGKIQTNEIILFSFVLFANFS